MSQFFQTIPNALRQHTLLKNDNPFRLKQTLESLTPGILGPSSPINNI
jgi:hypothetical protein